MLPPIYAGNIMTIIIDISNIYTIYRDNILKLYLTVCDPDWLRVMEL